jgi:TusA-related sulfurtransferase
MENIKEIDVRGMLCPSPLIFISKELNKIPVGEKLKIVADAPNFDKDLKIWCHDTGNKLLDLKKEGNTYTAIIERGKGWHGDTLWEKLKFYAIGIKLHLLMYLLEIFKSKKPKYLISFISIPEGFRAIDYLKEKGIEDFIVLPVPNEIYEYCGVVIGFKDKDKAIEIYKELKNQNFGVQDIHIVDKERKYPILQIES